MYVGYCTMWWVVVTVSVLNNGMREHQWESLRKLEESEGNTYMVTVVWQ